MIIELLLAGIMLFLLSAGFVFYKIVRKLKTYIPAGFNDNGAYKKPEEKKDIRFYTLALLWTYFNNGYSLASFPKWVLAIYGVGEVVNKNYNIVMIGAFFFVIFCTFIGWIYIKIGFLEAMNEVQNRNNLFMKEVRERKNI